MEKEVNMTADELLLVSEIFNLSVFVNKEFARRGINGFVTLSYNGGTDGIDFILFKGDNLLASHTAYFGWEGDRSVFNICQQARKIAEDLMKGVYDNDADGSDS